MPKKICIVGMAKSGTSALYSSIKAALPQPRRLVFEPENRKELAYVCEQDEVNGLTKLMFGAALRYDYDPAKFTHNVIIVRDHRDIIISSILFRFNRMRLINNVPLFEHLLARFEAKEKAPRSISVRSLLDEINDGEAASFKSYFRNQLDTFTAFIDETGNHVITFDQMIEGDFAALNGYLGLDLASPERLSGWVNKISRKGESGDWMHWFCDEDVAFFREALDPFIQRHGFSPDWTLADEPHIDPEHCSGYIHRLIRARQADPNLKLGGADDIDALRSAAEDGKTNAITKLVDILIEQGTDASKAEAYQLCEQLGEMGYGRQAVMAGKYFLRQKEKRRAIRSFENGVKAEYHPAFFYLGRALVKKQDGDSHRRGIELLERGKELGNKPSAELLEKVLAGGGE